METTHQTTNRSMILLPMAYRLHDQDDDIDYSESETKENHPFWKTDVVREKNPFSGLIDAHVHWGIFGRQLEEVVAELEWLESSGYVAVVVLPLPAMGLHPEQAVELLPGAVRNVGGVDVSRTVHGDFQAWLDFKTLWAAKSHGLQMFSFLDVRAWDGRRDMDSWWGKGHAGIKDILILEEDVDKMRMPPLYQVIGIGREAYLNVHRTLFTWAARWNVPVMYHVDLLHHAAFVEECLQSHPNLRVLIPHFGFSRRHMARLLERFPGVVTDISSLRLFIAANPESYRSFIIDYAERVLMGSDANSCLDLRPAFEYAQCVRELDLPDEVEAAILGGNARRFLGMCQDTLK